MPRPVSYIMQLKAIYEEENYYKKSTKTDKFPQVDTTATAFSDHDLIPKTETII